MTRALELHDEAHDLYAQGRYHDAIAKLNEAVSLDPQAKLLYYNLGLIEERIGDLDSALAHYKKVQELEKNPEEQAKLAHIVRRLEGAMLHEPKRGQSAAPSPAPTPLPEPESDARPTMSPWVWVAGGVTVSALIIGAALAVHAADLDPNGELTTSTDVSLDDLRADAAEAHDFAVGADAAFIIAGTGAVVTIVIVVMSLTGSDEPAQRLAWRF